MSTDDGYGPDNAYASPYSYDYTGAPGAPDPEPTHARAEAERLLPDEYGRDRLALGFDYSERVVDSIREADWDTLHQDWRPDYTFGSGREGAWVIDATPEALTFIDDLDTITVPPAEDIDYAVAADIRTLPSGPVAPECPACGAAGMHSEADARGAYVQAPPWARALFDTDGASHACAECQTLFRRRVSRGDRADADRERGGDVDPTAAINATPEQRARFLEREHDLREPVALTVAYREAGYSTSGIAGQLDSTEGTVSGYLRTIADRYGLDAIETKPLDGRTGPLGGDRR